MKILSKKEFEIEINKIVTYGVNDIPICMEDIRMIHKGDFFVSESLDKNIEDINQITREKDLLVMSSYCSCDENAMSQAISLAILDFEKNNLSLKDSDGILIYFQVNSNYKIIDIFAAMDIVHDRFVSNNHIEEPDILFGTSCDKCFEDGYVKATIFMSYSKKQTYINANNYIKKPIV